MQKQTVVIKIRVDKEIYDKICEIARREDRSYSKQINRILRLFCDTGPEKAKRQVADLI